MGPRALEVREGFPSRWGVVARRLQRCSAQETKRRRTWEKEKGRVGGPAPLVVGTLGLQPMYVDYEYHLFYSIPTFVRVSRVQSESGGTIVTIVELAEMRCSPSLFVG